MKKSFDIIRAFVNYREVTSSITNDLDFWRSFLSLSITNYQKQEKKPDEIYSSLFTSYDIDLDSNTGYLTWSKVPTSILTVDLEKHRLLFFTWIMNLSILKSYNALEILLHRAIWLRHFPKLSNPTESKKNSDLLQKEIKAELARSGIPADSKNNRYLIQFIKDKTPNYRTFLDLPIRVDLTTTWENFFEMMSILRNIIAHQGTIISNDTLNELKSKSKDIFNRHFDILTDENGEKHINPKEGLTALVDLMKDFGLNSLKLMFDKSDFRFIGMGPASRGF